MAKQPLLLMILDGWGIAPAGQYNAAALAKTPNLDALFDKYPHTRLSCSGAEATSDTKADSYSGEVSNNDISIEEAKLINYDDSDVVVVSFEFTNKTDSDQSFSGVYDVVAEQNGSSLAPATVIGVDGVELLTLSQNIAPGETITVQKAYKLDSKSSPLEITVQPFSSDDESFVTKTFNF